MELHIYLAFAAATAVMIALPGPSVLLTVAHSISFGWQRGLCTVAGATVGIAVQLIIAVIGLASLLDTAASAFEWFRWGGAAYLVFLGIRQWRNAGEAVDFDSVQTSGTRLLAQGLVVTVFNPKSLVFIAAFLPQFLDASQPPGPQFACIVPTFLVITFTVTGAWAWAAGNMGGLLRGRRAFRSVFRAAGGLMIVAGLGLAMAQRSS